MTYRDFVRRKMMQERYDKLSDEEKQHLYLMAQSYDTSRKLDDIAAMIKRRGFASDLLANISGNFITNGLIWVGSRLLKKI